MSDCVSESVSLSILSRPDGSASFNQGDTSVLAAVYGPGDVKMSKELIDKATVEVTYKNKIGIPGCAEKLQERIIRNMCETVIVASLHPRTSIEITLQEIQNSGCLLACCINAACLSLLNAAVPMKCMVAAVTVAMDTQTNDIIVNPTLIEEQNASAVLTFAFDSIDSEIVTIATTGSYSNEQFQKCLLASKETVDKIFNLYKNSLKRHLSNDAP